MTISDSELRAILINPKLNSRGQYICDCPFCGKERHFYISKTTQLFDCKKCGEKGNVYKILSKLDKLFLLSGRTIEVREKIDSIRGKQQDIEQNTELKKLPIVHMPVGWRVLKNGCEYLKNRGVSAEECIRYNIGSTRLFEKYKNYVLIPIYDNGEIRGFIGRYGSKNVPDNKLRYNNSVGTEFSELLFGYDEIVSNKTNTVILVEGIFDKISVDRFLNLDSAVEVKCVCTFGKKISKSQIQKLIIKGISRVILLYDPDALLDIRKYGVELEEYFETSIAYVDTKKDIDECSVDDAIRVFSNLMKPCDFNVNIIGKLKRK